MTKINQFDLAFVVDTTGSMGGLIEAAKKQMVEMVDALATAVDVDMQLGVVQYRDHPPQDRMVYRVHRLTGNLKEAKKTIGKLQADGGGDPPEAVSGDAFDLPPRQGGTVALLPAPIRNALIRYSRRSGG